ncbi:efflux RND transporter periplasmic adaptor subunit [Parasulfitobacter algicola]|nr:efflux RND transporter periplasmic adaptor subunit [Sulfitobacter algicola]
MYKRQSFYLKVSKLSLLVVALLVQLTVAFAQQTKDDNTLRPVKTMMIEAPSSFLAREFFGKIAARETVDLSFDVGGRMEVFPVLEGQAVAKDGLIARLDLAQYERAVEQAELSLDQAARELQRAQALVSTNSASRVRAQDAQTTRNLADIQLRAAKEALADAQLTAPFDGIVANRLVATYTNIQPGQPIVRLHDMSEIRVEVDVPERLFQQFGSFDDISFTAELPALESAVPLTVREFTAETGTIGQTYLVSLALPAGKYPNLIPGATATVIAQVKNGVSEAHILPASAVIPQPDKSLAVMVFDPQDDTIGIIRKTRIEAGSYTGTDIRVTGLQNGSEVVIAGAHLLKDGQKVRRFSGFTVQE